MLTKLKLFMALFALMCSPALAQEKMYLHVINVGQGSAMLIEFPCGVALIDTGGETNDEFQSTDALLNYLDQFFARRVDLNNTIDLLMISHPHIDHTRGAKQVAAKYRIKNLVTNSETKKGSGIAGQVALQQLAANSEATPTTSDDINFYASIEKNIPKGGITNRTIDPINCPGVNPVINLLWGTVLTNPGWNKEPFEDQNNHSVVCRIDFGQASMIMTGDLEDVAIIDLLKKHDTTTFNADVYLVGHHGSDNGTTLPFLKAISPEIAVLSFGENDRKFMFTSYEHGHPRKGIITMLESQVSGSRTPKTGFVATGKRKFVDKRITKAIYGIGWDDSFVLTGDSNGTWTYGTIPGAAIAPVADARININTATEAELQALPSIGATKARAIVAYRATNTFDTIDELDEVDGIGPATVNLLRPLVKV
jgi:competence ComEA-like helix-hairpin-helix protein